MIFSTIKIVVTWLLIQPLSKCIFIYHVARSDKTIMNNINSITIYDETFIFELIAILSRLILYYSLSDS